MKRIGILGAAMLLLLVGGCGRSPKLDLLRKLPELDTRGVDQYFEVTNVEIGEDKIFLIVTGKIKRGLGSQLELTVQRFTAEGPLDTVRATAKLVNRAIDPDTERRQRFLMFEEGDEIRIAIDATTVGAKITKMALSRRM